MYLHYLVFYFLVSISILLTFDIVFCSTLTSFSKLLTKDKYTLSHIVSDRAIFFVFTFFTSLTVLSLAVLIYAVLCFYSWSDLTSSFKLFFTSNIFYLFLLINLFVVVILSSIIFSRYSTLYYINSYYIKLKISKLRSALDMVENNIEDLTYSSKNYNCSSIVEAQLDEYNNLKYTYQQQLVVLKSKQAKLDLNKKLH